MADSLQTLLICPFCMKEIVDFNIIKTNEGISIQVNCSQKEKESLFKIQVFIDFLPKFPLKLSCKAIKDNQCLSSHNEGKDMYCFDCNEWMCNNCFKNHQTVIPKHYIYDFGSVLKCQRHQREFTLYCIKHSTTACPNCKDEHKNHKTIPLTPLDPKEIKQSIIQIESILSQENKLKDVFLNKSSDKDQCNEIISLAMNNHSFNQSIKSLYESLFHTALILATHSNYTLMKIRQMLQLYHLPIDTDISEDYDLIKKYYLTPSIIQIKKAPKESGIQSLKKKAKQYECFYSNKNENFDMMLLLNTGTLLTLSGSILSTYDTKDFKLIKTQNRLYAYSLNQLANGNIVLSNTNDIIIINQKTLEIIHKYPTGYYAIFSLRSFDDDRLILYHKGVGSLELWETKTFTKKRTIKEHHQMNYLIQLSDGCFALGSETIIEIWSKDFKKCVRQLKGHTQYISCIVELMNGNLVSSSHDKTIRVWNNDQCLTVKKDFKYPVMIMVQLLDESIACAEHMTGTILILDQTYFRCIAVLRGHDQLINSLIQLDNGTLVANTKNCMKLWKIA